MEPRRLVAHRGYPHRYPENTLVGIEAALRLGASHVEVDVQLSADAEPVLFHDRDLGRVCGVGGGIHERPVVELKVLRARNNRKGARVSHAPLATLGEFCALLDGYPEARALVEVKRIAVESFGVGFVVDAILRRLEPVVDRVVIISFDPGVLEESRRKGIGDLGLILETWSPKALAEAESLRASLVLCNVRKLPWRGSLAHDGFRLAVYDVVTPFGAEKWVRRGADLIETFAIGEMLEHFR